VCVLYFSSGSGGSSIGCSGGGRIGVGSIGSGRRGVGQRKPRTSERRSSAVGRVCADARGGAVRRSATHGRGHRSGHGRSRDHDAREVRRRGGGDGCSTTTTTTTKATTATATAATPPNATAAAAL